ncbi:hypothetical protein AK812_SmicGene1603 [Symbiodinium microadriaticum]|uniref:Uncharacterized protein n=1 Tax=Symbiodinium microadriaticum TaxID=2951 RepID=A0A1Q9F3J5_SYMMI|nr:hypothetical protein AK812_SmicGene1603 [Symbiodinium microadriaticum]
MSHRQASLPIPEELRKPGKGVKLMVKARKSSAVDDLADRLANVSSPAAFTEAAGSRAAKRASRMQVDAEMKEPTSAGQALSREELKRKLKAKLAGHALDRTQGLEKGQVDSSGLKKKTAAPSSKKMDVS